MKVYTINRDSLSILKENFGMEFFYREKDGVIYIKPISKSVLKRMKNIIGSDLIVKNEL